MDQEHRRSVWYDQTLPSAPASVPRKRRKNRTGVKVTAIVVCVLVLLVASVYAFSDSFGLQSALPKGDGSFTLPIPGLPAGDSGDSADGYDSDFRDYFDRYFIKSESSDKPSSIDRGDPGTLTLALQSAEGMTPLTLQALYTDCISSVVGIRAAATGKPGYYWGTGIVISDDGYILTNQHIISGTDKAQVILSDGAEFDALLIGEDVQTDIAVLKIGASGLQPAVFGNSGDLRVGDSVVAIGNPLTDTLSGTMTNGIISAIARNISSNGHSMTLLQTTAALNEGNSGGPLFNMYGQVVGITNMKMVNTYSSVSVEGIGFAIPSATVKTVTDQLIEKGRFIRPGIGITVAPIPADAAAHYKLPDGLYVSSVSAGSDAEAKGVRRGDILLKVDGVEVHSSEEVLALRDGHAVGDEMRFTLYRDGETFEVSVALGDLSRLY